jgi:hypothetical protein
MQTAERCSSGNWVWAPGTSSLGPTFCLAILGHSAPAGMQRYFNKSRATKSEQSRLCRAEESDNGRLPLADNLTALHEGPQKCS